jgi:CP family cyanate transporter-like MFS transporter
MRRVSGPLAMILGVQLLVGIALRPQFAGVAPLIPQMRAELNIPFALAGWLTAVPALFLGIMAFIGPAAARAIGARAAIGASLVLVLVFSIWRAAAADAAGVLAATFPIGVGIGLAGALIPGALGQLNRALYGSAMGVYALGLQIGAGGSVAIAVPLSLWLGGWRPALVVFAAPLLLALLVWLLAWRVTGGQERLGTETVLPRFSVVLVLVFALQSIAYHSTATWLPVHLIEAGWSESGAGAVLGLLNGLAVVGTIGVALWCRTLRSRVGAIVAGGALLTLSCVLIAVNPVGAILWAGVAGLAYGVLFPIAITLPLDYARDAREGLRLTAGTLGVGYLLSSGASTLTGGLRDVTGSFVPVFLLLALTGPALAVVALALRPPNAA